MTSESALLGLLADLYRDRAALEAENQQLRAELAAHTQPDDNKPSP